MEPGSDCLSQRQAVLALGDAPAHPPIGLPRCRRGGSNVQKGLSMSSSLSSCREHFYKLMNIEQYPAFLPEARQLAEEHLEKTRERLRHPPEDFNRNFLAFLYSHDALEKP